MSNVVLQADSLTKKIRGGSEILKAASLHVEAGEIVAVVGPSGAGKSTLLSLLGLLDRPSSGELRVLGTRVDLISARAAGTLRRRHLGFLFQNVHLLLGLTPLENVIMAMAYSELPRAERRERALAELNRVGLGGAAHQRSADLSGGERQRVALARAMVTTPDLLLCDEPTGSLDPGNSDLVIDLLHQNANNGVGVVVVTHSSELAKSASRMIEIVNGEVTA